MNVYEEVKAERDRQDAKWGGPEHDDLYSIIEWVGLLTIYLGHAALAGFNGQNDGEDREALVKVAALAVAAIESHDRKVAKAA